MGAQRLLRFLSGILLFSIVGCAGIQEIEEPVTTTAPLVDQLKTLISKASLIPSINLSKEGFPKINLWYFTFHFFSWFFVIS